MKNIIFLLTFMLLSINVFSQIATRTAVKAQVYTSSGTSPNFNVEILTSDDLSKFDATSVATGDFLYVIDGSDCYELVIDSVYSAAGNLLSISVYDADSVLTTIPTGQAAIVSPYQNYDLPFYVSTLREDLQSCIIQKMISRIDLIISGSTSTQEVLYPLVINKTGTDIFRGQVVMVDTSVLVQGDRMRIMLADNTLPANYIVGVASQDIPHNTEGFVTWFGYVNEVIHSNIAATGVTLDIGDILYISSEPGKYTDTEPLAPKLNSTIAIVIRKPNDSNITLLVRPWLNETLGELTDVDLTNLQDGNTIVWNNATKTWVKSSIDTSATNEIQNLSLSGQTLSISGSNNVILPVVGIMPANGINVASTNGVYTITNTKPDTIVTLNAGSNVTITGTYPTFNISSLNTTYSAGTGLSLTGTTFSHNAHTGDVTGTESLTVVGLQGRMLTSATPSNGQILKWNSTTSKWELGEDELGAPGTSDGVVTSIEVTGTTTKTITLTRSQSLANLTATFSDLTTNYTAGAGISIVSNVISNTAPDVPVVLNSGGIVNITGSYPTFTISATETDGSTTNELQSLSLSGQNLEISNGNSVLLPVVGITAGTGISAVNTTGNVTITNTLPESTSARNINGDGESIFSNQNGSVLNFRKIAVGGSIFVGGASSDSTLYLQGIDLTSARNVNPGGMLIPKNIYIDEEVNELRFRPLVEGYGILITEADSNLTFRVDTSLLSTKTWVSTRGYITSENDGSVENEGKLSVSAGTSTSSIINSNTFNSTGVTVNVSTGLGITETSNSITLTNTLPEATTARNIGTGNANVFRAEVGNELQFKKLVQGSNVTITEADSTITIAASSNPGTVTSITAGAGILADNVAGGVITTSGTLSAVDASLSNEGSLTVSAGSGTTSIINSNTSGSTGVTLSASTGLTISETGNTITLTNSSPDRTVTIAGSTGITATGTYPDFSLSVADQSATNELQTISTAANTVTLSNSGGSFTVAGAGINTVNTAGTTITVTGTEQDGSRSNEGSLSVLAGASNTSIIRSNTELSTDVTLQASTGLSITETGNTITLTNTSPNIIQTLGLSGRVLSISGANSVNLPVIGISGGTGIGVTSTDGNFTITNSSPESTTARNLNTSGEGIFYNQSGSELRFKELVQGTNITLVPGDSTITINSTATNDFGTVAPNKIAFGADTGDTLTSNNLLHWDNANGFLGIGTSSPSQRLTVNGNIGVGTYKFYSSTLNSLIISDTIGTSNNQTVKLGTGLLTGTQNTGVGAGAGGTYTGLATSIFIGRNASASGNDQINQIVIGANTFGRGSNTTIIGNQNTVSTYLPGGSLMINSTVNPERTLHVTGEARITDLITDTPTRIVGADADGDLGEITTGNGLTITSGALRVDTATIATVYALADTASNLRTVINAKPSGSGAANKIAYWSDSNTLTSDTDLHYDAGNNRLGIGASSPAYDLSLASGSRTIGMPDVNGTTGGFFTIKTSGAAGGTNLTGGMLILEAGYSTGLSGSEIVFNTAKAGASGSTIRLSTESMRISQEGRLGINTTSPSRLLHVAGEVRITDLTTDTPTRIVGADADGDLGEIIISTGLSLSGSNLTVPTMTGATVSVNGTSGLVPTPLAGQNVLFLRGDGTWANPTTGGDNWGSQVVATNATLSGNGLSATPLSLASGVVTTGTYKSVTVDTYGRVTAGTNPTTLSGYGITDAQPLDSDLTAIAGLTGSTGLLRKTAENTWSIDNTTYLTGNQNISLTGDITGSGTTNITTSLSTTGVVSGTYNNTATAITPFTVDAKGRITSVGSNVTITPSFANVTSKPTTLSGYGITDALFNSTTSTQNGYFGDIHLYDDNTPSHYLQITNSGNLTGTKLLNINVMDADKSIILSGNLTVSANANIQGTNTGDQTITLSGDVTGSGTGPITTTLANSGVTAGTYTAATVTVDAKGRVTSASSNTISTVNNGILTLNTSGEGISGSQTFTANQASGVTFTVTSNATSGNVPSTIVSRNSSGNFTAGTITAALSGNATTASTLQNARTIQTNLSSTSAASFNGSTNITPGVTGTLPIANGGTGATTAGAAIQNLLPSYTSNQSKVLALNSSATALEWVANQSSGVTGTGAANKVAFWTGANTLSNNTNLHWDNTEERLGINNTSPSERLQVGGNVRAERFITNAFGAQTLTFSNIAPTNAEGYNVFINQGNLQLTASTSTEASRNLGIGYASLTALTTGSQNTAYGVYTASSLSTGIGNSAIGTQALFSLTTGGQNFGIGTAALAAIVTESDNIGIGHTAGYQIRGNANTLIGSVVAQQMTSGSNLTAIGGYAAYNLNGGGLLTSASNGVFIGYDTRASANSNTNEIVIGYEGRGNGSNTTTLGNTSTTGTFLAAGNLNLTGQAATVMQTARNTSAGQAGNNLTIKVGGSGSGSNLNGGNLVFESGISTGNGTSNIVFRTPTQGVSGTVDNVLSEKLRITSDGSVLLEGSTGRTLGSGRNEETDVGNSLIVQAGGAKINATNAGGGTLVLRSGISTGNQSSTITFQTATSGTSSTDSRTPTEKMRINGAGNVGINTTTPATKLSVNGAISASTPVSITSGYTIGVNDMWMFVNVTAAINITFPDATSFPGRIFTIKTISTGFAVSSTGSGSTIWQVNGHENSNVVFASTDPVGTWKTFVSDGTRWIVMQKG